MKVAVMAHMDVDKAEEESNNSAPHAALPVKPKTENDSCSFNSTSVAVVKKGTPLWLSSSTEDDRPIVWQQ